MTDDLARGLTRLKAQLEQAGKAAPAPAVSAAPTLTIGRDASCTWQIDDPYVSPLHATMYRRADGSVWIRDEGSRNGLWINGLRVYDRPVKAGDAVTIGRTELTIPDLYPT